METSATYSMSRADYTYLKRNSLCAVQLKKQHISKELITYYYWFNNVLEIVGFTCRQFNKMNMIKYGFQILSPLYH